LFLVNLQVILKEREERKHNRLLLERGLDPQQESGGLEPQQESGGLEPQQEAGGLEPQQESRPAEEPSLEEPEEASDTGQCSSFPPPLISGRGS